MTSTTWPEKGASSDATQPWQDSDSDITPRAGLPVLASGSADPSAPAIFAALARLGYETPITRGENPVGVIGPEELAAVRQFRQDYGVREDPDAIVGSPDSVVGPWTAEAILRADEHAQETADAPLPSSASDNGGLDERLDVLEERVTALEHAEPAAVQAPESPASDATPPSELSAAAAPAAASAPESESSPES